MKIKIISLQKSPSKSVQTLEAEYLKRIQPYATVSIIDIKHVDTKPNKELRVKVEKHIKANDIVVLLSEKGREYTSEGLAAHFQERMNKGQSSFVLIIGGASGFPPEIADLSTERLSLSKLTMPHKLARLFLVEALYRTFDILRGGKYNK